MPFAVAVIQCQPVREVAFRMNHWHVRNRRPPGFALTDCTGPCDHRAEPDHQFLTQLNGIKAVRGFSDMDTLAYQAAEIQLQLQQQRYTAPIQLGRGGIADNQPQLPAASFECKPTDASDRPDLPQHLTGRCQNPCQHFRQAAPVRRCGIPDSPGHRETGDTGISCRPRHEIAPPVHHAVPGY